MVKPILLVFVTADLKGPFVGFKFEPGAREALEKMDLLPSLGDAMATFGEQLKLRSMGIATVEPGVLYGPDGQPV